MEPTDLCVRLRKGGLSRNKKGEMENRCGMIDRGSGTDRAKTLALRR